MKKYLMRMMVLAVVLIFAMTPSYAADPKASAKPAPAKATEQKTAQKDDKAAKQELIDINSATKEQLLKVQGDRRCLCPKNHRRTPLCQEGSVESKEHHTGRYL